MVIVAAVIVAVVIVREAGSWNIDLVEVYR